MDGEADRAAAVEVGNIAGAPGRLELKLLSEILVCLTAVALLPYLLYWLLWLVTGRGLPPKTPEQLESRRKRTRALEMWALKAVAMTALAVALYVATMFFRAH